MNQPGESKPNDLSLVKTIKGVIALQPTHPAPIGGPHLTQAVSTHPSPHASVAGTPPEQPTATTAKPADAQSSARGFTSGAGTTPPPVPPEADLRAIEAWENEGDPN